MVTDVTGYSPISVPSDPAEAPRSPGNAETGDGRRTPHGVIGVTVPALALLPGHAAHRGAQASDRTPSLARRLAQCLSPGVAAVAVWGQATRCGRGVRVGGGVGRGRGGSEPAATRAHRLREARDPSTHAALICRGGGHGARVDSRTQSRPTTSRAAPTRLLAILGSCIRYPARAQRTSRSGGGLAA